MSVLIKGMDMPKSCRECPCSSWEGSAEKPRTFCHATKDHKETTNGRDACPLVEVPKYGRLIDAASVEEKARAYVKKYDERSAKNRHPCREVIDYGRFLDMKWSARADGAEAVADMIANAPTVIEGD